MGGEYSDGVYCKVCKSIVHRMVIIFRVKNGEGEDQKT